MATWVTRANEGTIPNVSSNNGAQVFLFLNQIFLSPNTLFGLQIPTFFFFSEGVILLKLFDESHGLGYIQE